MLFSGSDPESNITEYTLVYKDFFKTNPPAHHCSHTEEICRVLGREEWGSARDNPHLLFFPESQGEKASNAP